MPSHHPGDLLRVRGSVWRLRSQTTYDTCAELELDPLGRSTADSSRILLEPFDKPTPLPRDCSPLVVSRRAWLRGLLDAISIEHRCDGLLATAAAGIEIFPYQLVPALAMTIQGVSRVLLADAVGLGKTIQAGLVIAELRSRHLLRRALVLTPPGLRDQWCNELRERFGFDPVVADAAWLRTMRLELPVTENPWRIPLVVITSIDFAKRPDVRGGLDELAWDIVVVDEAHTASMNSDRRSAAHSLARHARRVLLLSATPHAGDAAAFDALTRIGAMPGDESIAIIRRTRSDVGYCVRRHVHLLPVHLTPVERELYDRLLAYIARMWRERTSEADSDARLAAIVLLKRANSSIASLAESLVFRLTHLADPAAALVAQLDLPLGEDTDGTDDVPLVSLAAPGFEDSVEERKVLAALIELALEASATDSKIRALARWITRVPESCVVFTEYRDTLAAIERALGGIVPITTLHGGLDRTSRIESLQRFSSGAARVLLATDAGGEGLNLQTSCRVVVNLELPWNPIRLEQRIGRVDRIGQRRTVHAINLVAADTHEASVLSRLVLRLGHIRGSLGSFDEVLGPIGERAVASLLLGVPRATSPWSPTPDCGPPATDVPVRFEIPASEIRQHCVRVLEQRVVWNAYARRRPARRSRSDRRLKAAHTPKVATISLRRLRQEPTSRSGGGFLDRPGVLVVYRSTIVDAASQVFDETLVPLFTPFPVPRLRRRRDATELARRWLRATTPHLEEIAGRCQAGRLELVGRLHARHATAGQERERAIYSHAAGPRVLVQGGLFDQRGERNADDRRRVTDDARTDGGFKRSVALGGVSAAGAPVLAFVLLVTP